MDLFVSLSAPIVERTLATSQHGDQTVLAESSNFGPNLELRPTSQSEVISFVTTPPIHVASSFRSLAADQTQSPQSAVGGLPQVELAEMTQNPNSAPSHPEKLLRDCTTLHRNHKIRSTGRITTEEAFPFNDLNSSPESGSENSPTTESEELLYSPINNYLTYHEPIEGYSKPQGIRRSFYSLDVLPQSTLQEIATERLARWRPSDSQHNTEKVLEGKHPYDKDSPEQGNQVSFIQRLFGYDSKNSPDPQPSIPHRTINDECKFCTEKQNENNILSSIQAANNSSLSMVLYSSTARTHQQESNQLFTYTPKAFPIEGGQLNFTRGTPPDIQGDYLDEMRDVFDEVDDFCLHCLNSVTTFFTGNN